MKKVSEIITEDFNIMRKMISEIEVRLIPLKDEKQINFYRPIMNIIITAFEDLAELPKDELFVPNTEQAYKNLKTESEVWHKDIPDYTKGCIVTGSSCFESQSIITEEWDGKTDFQLMMIIVNRCYKTIDEQYTQLQALQSSNLKLVEALNEMLESYNSEWSIPSFTLDKAKSLLSKLSSIPDK